MKITKSLIDNYRKNLHGIQEISVRSIQLLAHDQKVVRIKVEVNETLFKKVLSNGNYEIAYTDNSFTKIKKVDLIEHIRQKDGSVVDKKTIICPNINGNYEIIFKIKTDGYFSNANDFHFENNAFEEEDNVLLSGSQNIKELMKEVMEVEGFNLVYSSIDELEQAKDKMNYPHCKTYETGDLNYNVETSKQYVVLKDYGGSFNIRYYYKNPELVEKVDNLKSTCDKLSKQFDEVIKELKPDNLPEIKNTLKDIANKLESMNSLKQELEYIENPNNFGDIE